MVKKIGEKIFKILCWIGFIIYLIAMVYFLFFSETLGRTPSAEYHYNFHPFVEIRRYVLYSTAIGGSGVLLNLAGNVFCFLPFGFVLPVLSNKQRGVLRITFLSFLGSTIIEVTQLVTKVGACDIDDVILNTLGGFLGYLLYCLVCKVIKRHRKHKKVKK